MTNPLTDKFKEVCIGCELEGAKYVECKGIYYCANPLCTSVGSTHHKAKAPGVYPNDNNGYDIKDVDFFWDWCQEKYAQETDPNIKAAMARKLPYWKEIYEKWFAEHGEKARMQHLTDVVDS